MEIKISRNANKCLLCLKSFSHEEWVWSQIVELNKEWQRRDFCISCWQQSEKQPALSQWRHRYVDPKERNKEQETKDSPLRALFYEMIEKDHSRLELAIAYLASQLLKREKVFKRIKEMAISPKEGHIIMYIDRIDDRVIEVRDPNFTFSEMEEAKNIILRRLEGNTEIEKTNLQNTNSITNA
ncbi:MAG TPA: hypothetical protein PLT82_09110 [Candidatus Hydrogenedens sp.]|nr:hypothetical protein [Candidatus Hydrogenedens sp.]HOK09573.1 hypothetical protein [Candidatus Hydrogenedens sp.]HOL18809.1 hypothetical protein [Candidatus Hydrogenedens sp.]HPP59277.1 hypothetical protein [Candidatus Hydrogenedens sp.]